MKIHFIQPGNPETVTGGYNYNRQVISGLENLGHRLNLVNPGSDFPNPSADSLQNAQNLLLSIPAGELVLSDSLVTAALSGFLQKMSLSHPIVCLVHLPRFLEPSISVSMQNKLKLAEKQIYEKAAGIIVTSNYTAQKIEELGIATSKIKIALPGVSVSKRKENYYPKPYRLLCVSNYTRNKGHLMLIEALSQLRYLPWELTCYGNQNMEPEYFHQIEMKIQDIGLTNRISLRNTLQGDVLQNAYLSSDLCILASPFETYGMVLSEALACGLPVIAFRTGGTPDAIPDGCGILVAPITKEALELAIGKVLYETDFYPELCHRVKEYSYTSLNWEKTVRQIEIFLSEIKQPHNQWM